MRCPETTLTGKRSIKRQCNHEAGHGGPHFTTWGSARGSCRSWGEGVGAMLRLSGAELATLKDIRWTLRTEGNMAVSQENGFAEVRAEWALEMATALDAILEGA